MKMLWAVVKNPARVFQERQRQERAYVGPWTLFFGVIAIIGAKLFR